MKKYDIVVIGAGHAGIEAALAAARLGSEVLLLTISLDSVALMPCNPNIGGTGKGHLVREIDALGGEMGLNTDRVTIQSKMLNTAKGPAVHSLRVQTDKFQYQTEMKKVLEETPGLTLRQGEVEAFEWEGDHIVGVRVTTGISYEAKLFIIATGTYLKSTVFIGHRAFDIGPSSLKNSKAFADQLQDMGIALRRFKTGTPARVHAKSVDYSKFSPHPGDAVITPFSFLNDSLEVDQVPCWLGYTTTETHRIIQENIERSAMYSGLIEGTGARYCPSIEDKITRFADRLQHQLFLEPEGLNTQELYVQGMSTSLPEDVQERFLQSIPGLEKVQIMRPGYAIEYDCIDPRELLLSLQHRTWEQLFFAGQINGSSGYEEAAAQGLIAGINAHRKLQRQDPIILHRDQAYIGVLIDDLVTKGTNEPFRMMTSRCEYRLVLRQDNADLRLTPLGREIGLASEARYQKLLEKQAAIDAERKRVKSTVISKDLINPLFEKMGLAAVIENIPLERLLRRSELDYASTESIDVNRPNLPQEIFDSIEIELKYQGYIEKQLKQIDQFRSLENKKIPKDIDYHEIRGLRIEAMQKLSAQRPESLGQASRISGVNPADIQVLLIWLESKRRRHE